MVRKFLFLCAFVILSGVASAQVSGTIDEVALAAESEAYAVATASDPLTPQLIMQKVDEACEMLKKEGFAAFSKFKGKGSEFIFSGTYIWIHDEEGTVLMHPIMPKIVGKSLLGLTDIHGKLFFVEINSLVHQRGAGWVDYWWPKPGETEATLKVSYVKGVTIDGKLLILGCGVYGFTPEQIETLKKSK